MLNSVQRANGRGRFGNHVLRAFAQMLLLSIKRILRSLGAWSAGTFFLCAGSFGAGGGSGAELVLVRQVLKALFTRRQRLKEAGGK